MSERFFTPGAARRALGVIRPHVDRIRRIYRALERSHTDAFHLDGPVSAGYYEAILALERVVFRLTDLGVLVRDPVRGAVVFPARRRGREVFLCWSPGEPSVSFWQDPCDASPVRRPIDDDGPWDEPGRPTD